MDIAMDGPSGTTFRKDIWIVVRCQTRFLFHKSTVWKEKLESFGTMRPLDEVHLGGSPFETESGRYISCTETWKPPSDTYSIYAHVVIRETLPSRLPYVRPGLYTCDFIHHVLVNIAAHALASFEWKTLAISHAFYRRRLFSNCLLEEPCAVMCMHRFIWPIIGEHTSDADFARFLTYVNV